MNLNFCDFSEWLGILGSVYIFVWKVVLQRVALEAIGDGLVPCGHTPPISLATLERGSSAVLSQDLKQHIRRWRWGGFVSLVRENTSPDQKNGPPAWPWVSTCHSGLLQRSEH